MGSPHPWFPLHLNTYFGCFCLPVSSEPAVRVAAPVNSPYKREVFCLFSFMNQFATGVRWALQLLQEKKQEQADSVCGRTTAADRLALLFPVNWSQGLLLQWAVQPSLVQLWGWKLTNSSVQQLPGVTLLWPHEHYSQNQRSSGNGTPPPKKAGTTFFNDSLYLCHLKVSRELHSIPGCWFRDGADLRSCSPSIIHMHIHT